MVEVNDFSIIAKEVITILFYCEEDIINKIPKNFLNGLSNYAADSQKEFFIDPNKSLQEQNITEESKNLLSLIYYSFIADENEKKVLKQVWDNNEKKYQDELSKKYSVDSLFKDNNKINRKYFIETNTNCDNMNQNDFNINEENNLSLIEVQKNNIIIKIINKIKSFFNKNF